MLISVKNTNYLVNIYSDKINQTFLEIKNLTVVYKFFKTTKKVFHSDYQFSTVKPTKRKAKKNKQLLVKLHNRVIVNKP